MTLALLPETEEELERRAEKSLDMQSKNYVEDALMFARWITERGLPALRKMRDLHIEVVKEKETLKELVQGLMAEREGTRR